MNGGNLTKILDFLPKRLRMTDSWEWEQPRILVVSVSTHSITEEIPVVGIMTVTII